MTSTERAAVRLVIEAMAMMLKALYRLLPGTTAEQAMKKLDEADEMLKPIGE